MENNETHGRVVYLIGAGASANSLPIVNDIPGRLESFTKRIVPFFNAGRGVLDLRDFPGGKLPEVLEDLSWLIDNTKKHLSIDTFAKKLFVTKAKKELKKLKKLLALFFIYEQTGEIDKRYDAFIASIIESNGELDDRVNIISWNYDYQFELAFSEYLKIYDLNIIQEKLNVFPTPHVSWPKSPGVKLLKLNGTTTFFNKKENEFINAIKDVKVGQKEIDLNEIVKEYYYKPEFETALQFAWEVDQQQLNAVMDFMMVRCETLVIIGYSFPYFNRVIDRLIYKNFKGENIYIQDKYPEKIADNMKAIIPRERNVRLTKIDNTDQFFIPPEL